MGDSSRSHIIWRRFGPGCSGSSGLLHRQCTHMHILELGSPEVWGPGRESVIESHPCCHTYLLSGCPGSGGLSKSILLGSSCLVGKACAPTHHTHSRRLCF